MSLRLGELAELVGGVLTGDGQLEIQGAAPLREARPGDITFADHARHFDQLARSQATAAVVVPDLVPTGMSFISVENAREAFTAIMRAFCPPRHPTARAIHPQACISPSAQLAGDVTVHAGCVIGEEVEIGSGCILHAGVTIMDGCRLENDVTLFPRVVLYENTRIGARSIIHAGAVIGAYGFGYQLQGGQHVRTPQLGHVVIEADVEIGANATIDRGTYGATVIGQGSKLDNQVMVGHNCRVGRHNLLCAQVGIAGSCTTGDHVVMAGQVGVRDHIDIGDGVMIGAKSGVSENLTAAGKYLGAPALPLREEIQLLMARQKLPEMRRGLRRLERALEALSSAPPLPDVEDAHGNRPAAT